MRRPRLAPAVSVLVMAAAGVAGCGGGSSSSAQPATAAAAPAQVTIKGYKFHPAAITVAVGGAVVFTNEDGSKHTATAKDAADQAFFDTDGLAKGHKAMVRFRRAGTYAYICAYHPFMHGTVVVK